MNEREALRLALEALENHSGNYKLSRTECVKHNAIVDAIKQALANDVLDRMAENERELGIQMQPEQEPVAKTEWDIRGFLASRLKCWHRLTAEEATELVALYTFPPKREPLTDEEIEKAFYEFDGARTYIISFAHAIEAKLKEKNT